MNQRRVGVVLLAVVALAALVVRGSTGRVVVGSPVSEVAPAPPVEGDCVTSFLSRPPGEDPTLRPEYGDGDGSAPVSFPVAAFGSCTGPMVGEVMSVDPAHHDLDSATLSSYQAALSECELSEVNYVGSIGPVDPGALNTPQVSWWAAVDVKLVAIGPSALQGAAGQRWTACVGSTERRVPYTGRLAGALTDGALPPAFATCSLSLKTPVAPDLPQVPCTTLHLVEILASIGSDASHATVAELRRGCLGMASRALRSPDPTRGGRLRIDVYASAGADLRPLGSVDQLNIAIVCAASVDPPYHLLGTLIGVGDKPLPITR